MGRSTGRGRVVGAPRPLPPSPQELALSTLMKLVQLEGAHPLEKPKWEGSYLFPRQLFKVRGAWGSRRSSGRSRDGRLFGEMLCPIRPRGGEGG